MKKNRKVIQRYNKLHKNNIHHEVVNDKTNVAILDGIKCLVGEKAAPVAHTVKEAMGILNKGCD